MTLAAYLHQVFGPSTFPRLSPAWRFICAREVRIIAASSLGSERLDRLTPIMVELWWNAHMARGFPVAANKQLQILRQALKKARTLKLITEDLTVGIKKMKESKDRVRWLEPEQRIAILDDARRTNPRVLRYIWLAMHTIVRRGSLYHVDRQDIDLQRGCITYRHMKNREGGVTMPLVATCLDEVAKWLAEPGPLLYQYKRADGVTQAFRKIVRRLKIQGPGCPDGKFTFHDLRHDLATRLKRANFDLGDIQAIGAWKSIAMVARYAHVDADRQRKALTQVLEGRTNGTGKMPPPQNPITTGT